MRTRVSPGPHNQGEGCRGPRLVRGIATTLLQRCDRSRCEVRAEKAREQSQRNSRCSGGEENASSRPADRLPANRRRREHNPNQAGACNMTDASARDEVIAQYKTSQEIATNLSQHRTVAASRQHTGKLDQRAHARLNFALDTKMNCRSKRQKCGTSFFILKKRRVFRSTFAFAFCIFAFLWSLLPSL